MFPGANNPSVPDCYAALLAEPKGSITLMAEVDGYCMVRCRDERPFVLRLDAWHVLKAVAETRQQELNSSKVVEI